MTKHTFTTRIQGDMKDSEKNRKRVVFELFGNDREIITMRQKHSNEIGIDARISTGKESALVAFAADCVPVLLSDDHVYAAVHAGWKGTLGRITQKTVEEMKNQGAYEIRAWIGPHIGMCHYDVTEERASSFRNEFGDDFRVASFFENNWHIDLGWVNFLQLQAAGIKKEHIVAPPTCTYCQNDTYFSYRREKGNLDGEIMGVIGIS